MEQFALFKNPDKKSKSTYPYFLSVQSDLVSDLNSRLVIPLVPVTKLDASAPEKLCPILEIASGKFALMTHQLTSIPASTLKNPIANFDHFSDEIIAAIDLLISGI